MTVDMFIFASIGQLINVSAMHCILKSILNMMRKSVATGGPVCCDVQPDHWLPHEDRKLTDGAEEQTHHTVCKAGMPRCRLITSANQVS